MRSSMRPGCLPCLVALTRVQPSDGLLAGWIAGNDRHAHADDQILQGMIIICLVGKRPMRESCVAMLVE